MFLQYLRYITFPSASNGKKTKDATEVVTASVEPSPKNSQEINSNKKLSLSTSNTNTTTATNNSVNSDEKQGLLILERPKRISFCKDPVITTLDSNSKMSTTVVNQSIQPSVS